VELQRQVRLRALLAEEEVEAGGLRHLAMVHLMSVKVKIVCM
jgi:hypothetical protein